MQKTSPRYQNKRRPAAVDRHYYATVRRLSPVDLPCKVAADDAANSDGRGLLTLVLFVGFFFIVLWLLVRRAGMRHQPYLDRGQVHMDRIEKQNEEIISLLREIAGKTGPNPKSQTQHDS